MPVKILVGLIVVAAALPLLTVVIGSLVAHSPDNLYFLLKGIRR